MAPFTESSLWNVLIWLHVFVLVPVLLVMVSVTISLPIENRDSRAIDRDSCEFGDTFQPYDEDCLNGATQVLPCNPGQLKVSECIGQDGDTSRMCYPCPQKYYQTYYNRCTRCRECSECGANEYIKEPCNDESDTVCESIPPEQVPTTTPRRTTIQAIDWDSCEFGDTYQPYDEDCPNGAIQIPPCNPGQLKVSECIEQGGDISRMCRPCPQKYYQSHYNRCTRCRACSQCGVNEYIKEPCNDTSDTVCESIIPPDPVPTTTPKLTTHMTTQESTQLSTYRSVTATELSSVGTNRTHAVTYRNNGTTEISTFLTTLAEREEPKAVYGGIDTIALTVSAVIIIIIFFVIILVTVIVLVTINQKQRKKIKDLKTLINNSKGTEMDTTFENVYEEASKTPETYSNEAETAGLTVMTVQVNDIDAESEVNVSENSDGEHRGLQGSGGADSEKSKSGSEAPLQTGTDNRNRSRADWHKVGSGGRDTAGRKAPTLTPDPTDTDTDAEGPSSVLCQADVHRDAASSTVPSPNYENLPEDGSHQGDERNAPSTSHASSGGSRMEDFSGSRATGSERTSEGTRSDLPTTSKKGGLGEKHPSMQPQTLPEMGSQGTKEQKRKGFDSQRFWMTFYSRN